MIHISPINHNNRVGDFHPGRAERRRRLKHRSTASNEVFDNETNLIALKGPLNSVGGAVVLDLLAAHDHGNARRDGNAGGDGEGGVRDAADDVVTG